MLTHTVAEIIQKLVRGVDYELKLEGLNQENLLLLKLVNAANFWKIDGFYEGLDALKIPEREMNLFNFWR